MWVVVSVPGVGYCGRGAAAAKRRPPNKTKDDRPPHRPELRSPASFPAAVVTEPVMTRHGGEGRGGEERREKENEGRDKSGKEAEREERYEEGEKRKGMRTET